MKKIAFGILIIFIDVNIVMAEPSVFFKEFDIVNGTMSTNYSKYNDMYTVYVDENVYSLVFDYLLEDEEASVIITGNDLLNDSNDVIITIVDSVDQNKKNYYFSVYKYKEQEVFSENNDMLKLEVNTKSKKIHVESIVAIFGFLLILLTFYRLFLT